MNGYKKIFRNKKLRFKLLSMLRFIPDKQMLRLQYWIKHHRKLNLKDPKRYTEKIQWYKLYYRNPAMQQCADKYKVRQYIESKGLGHILNRLYAVFTSPEEICLEALPDEFVLKLSNGSGTNLLVEDKAKLDIEQVRKSFRDFDAQRESSAGREWVYRGERDAVIVAEALLKDPDRPQGDLCDYKILCFNGNPEYVVYDTDRFTEHKRNIYDTQWNDLRIGSDCPCIDGDIPKPDTLEEMLEIARILSADFPAARIDLYSIGGKVYFGEITFFPWSGYVNFDPDSFDFDLGKKFVLPKAE